jgi:hypothetical protein
MFLVLGECPLPDEPEPLLQDTIEIAGIFVGYSLGDYYHAVFLDEEGYMITAYAPNGLTPGLDVFLFQHRGSRVVVKAVTREVELFEAGKQIITLVVDCWAPGETYSQWCGRMKLEHEIETQEEFTDLFGDPALTERLFDEMVYMNGSSAGTQ